MKALTVQQPWAQVIASGDKLVENRSWSTLYRGPLAIHAGARFSTRGMRDARVGRWAAERGMTYDAVRWLPTGVVVATCELEDCHPAAWCCPPWGEHEYAEADGKVRHTVHHWLLANVKLLAEPVPAKGRLGLWTVDL